MPDPVPVEAMSPAERRKEAESLLDLIRNHYEELSGRERQLWNQMWAIDWCSGEQLEILRITLERFR